MKIKRNSVEGAMILIFLGVGAFFFYHSLLDTVRYKYLYPEQEEDLRVRQYIEVIFLISLSIIILTLIVYTNFFHESL